MREDRPVWAEINLDYIKHNYQEVRSLVGKREVMAIVKANAYGHGMIPVAQALDDAGADSFGVAIVNEAIELRDSGIKKPILILGWTPTNDYERALSRDIKLTIYCLEDAVELSRVATELNKKAIVHLKVDTGMSRLGFQPNQASIDEIEKIIDLDGIVVEGIYTHFAKSDELDKSYTNKQIELFNEFVNKIETEKKHKFKIKHAANSAAIIDHPEAYFDLVRPGIMLYGLKPSNDVQLSRVDLKQVLSLKARVSHVKKVPKQTAVSYGGKYVTEQDCEIATIPIGYADGYTRLLSDKSYVIYKDQKLPVIGRICMDQFMINSTNASPTIKKGDIVTLMGYDNKNFLSIDEIAEILGTINYEVSCMISARVPRLYSGGK